MKIAIKLLTLIVFIAFCALGVVYKEKERKIRRLEFERDSIMLHNYKKIV